MSTVRIASPIIYRVNSRKNVRERSGRQLTRNVCVAAAFLDHQGLSPLCNLVRFQKSGLSCAKLRPSPETKEKRLLERSYGQPCLEVSGTIAAVSCISLCGLQCV